MAVTIIQPNTTKMQLKFVTDDCNYDENMINILCKYNEIMTH